MEGKEKRFVLKFDLLNKHVWRKGALADMGKVRRGKYYYYYFGTYQHVKNECVFFANGGQTVINKVLFGITKERTKKIVQFQVCMHIL